MNRVRWIPELERETVILQRIFLAEKWLVARLHYGHIDPREAGVGNIVNCGAAMYMTPVGIANAGDPAGAYAEAIDMAGAHQSSYGREAAGVFAAAVAEAMRPGATVDSVVETAIGVARDGTQAAIEAVAAVAHKHDDWRQALGDLREAITAYDTVGPNYREPLLDARIPSRTKSIEELPVALGFAVVSGGDYRDAVLGGVNYGRDADSIATMAGAITGALGGAAVVPSDWLDDVTAASRIDLAAPAATMVAVAREIWARDAERAKARDAARARSLMPRVTWVQPEDLVPHALAAKRLDGCDVEDVAARWLAAGGRLEPPTVGATPEAASDELRALARQLLAELDSVQLPDALTAAEPDDLGAIEALAPGAPATPPASDLADRIHGGWLGRAAGCLLGKPVEKIPRHGIRAIAESTGNWPISTYFTAIGLDPDVAAAYPWNRASRTTSLVENIAGMPEDDDLNFAIVALTLVEQHGEALTTDDVAAAWLSLLPGGRVFTAERIAYRNLLDGHPPAVAGRVGNPFQDWIGAQIRTDVYGWVASGDPARAARLAWQDGRLSHSRNGLYGAMFVAAASAAAVVTSSIAECVEAGLSVVPAASRYAAAVRRGAELGHSGLDPEVAIDAIYAEFGHLHWVHVLNNAALLAFALTRSEGDFATAITTVVSGGWDTDSTGATAGSICGALTGAAKLPSAWIEPLANRLSTSMPGFDGIGFDELARRTVAARLS